MTDHASQDDPLELERDERKLHDQGEAVDGPPVARMATTYGTSYAGSEEEAREIASDETDEGVGTDDGLGNAPPPG